jgi:hypothetical protein
MPTYTAAAAQLTAMGFNNDAAVTALERSLGDLDEAVLLLTCEAHAPPRPPSALKRQRARADSPAPDEMEVVWSAGKGEEDTGTDGDEPPPEDEVKRGATPSLEAWDQLPQDVLEIVGRWLAVHLGNPPKRLASAPVFLHPLAIFRDNFVMGRARLQTTLEKLTAMRTCRQTCRAWRNEITYSKVRELTLDGVRVNPKTWCRSIQRGPDRGGGKPGGGFNRSSNQLSAVEMRDAGATSTVTHTWWPSNRPIFARRFDPGSSRFSAQDRAHMAALAQRGMRSIPAEWPRSAPGSRQDAVAERQKARNELNQVQLHLTRRLTCPVCGPVTGNAMDAIYATDEIWANPAERANPANWILNPVGSSWIQDPAIGRHCSDRIFVGPLSAESGCCFCAECNIPIEPREKRYACRLDCKQHYCPCCALGDYKPAGEQAFPGTPPFEHNHPVFMTHLKS